jgi:hypothetical protein
MGRAELQEPVCIVGATKILKSEKRTRRVRIF